jgi:hypothetical protein
MDWPVNLPDDVTAKMRELHEAGVKPDYYGAKFWGGTGYVEADNLLAVHQAYGWIPDYTGIQAHAEGAEMVIAQALSGQEYPDEQCHLTSRTLLAHLIRHRMIITLHSPET